MATGAQVWSTTAASNNTVDSQVNWSEGMAPSAVNDSARAEMASVAMFIGDNSGTLATGGTTTAFTISSRQISTGFADGKTIAVRMHATNEANATLNLDGIGPKNIQIYADQNISYGQLTGGSIHRFTYNSASTGWIVNSFPGQNAYLTSLDVVGATSFGAVSMISASISSTLNVSGAVSIGGALRTASLVTTGSANITDTTLIGAAWAAYTPTITSVGGTINSVSASGSYSQVGKTVNVRGTITITDAGTAGSQILITLPVNPQQNGCVFTGSVSGGKGLSGFIDGTGRLQALFSDGTTPCVNGTIQFGVVYEAS